MEPNPGAGRSPGVTVPSATVRASASVAAGGGPPSPGSPSDPAPPFAAASTRASISATTGEDDDLTGPDSFEHFYATERVRLGRAVALALGEVDLAAEATDEAFARAFERWSTISWATRRGGCTGWRSTGRCRCCAGASSAVTPALRPPGVGLLGR